MIKNPRFQSRLKKFLMISLLLALILPAFSMPVFASSVDVAGPIVDAFNTYMKPQIEKVFNYAILPLIDAFVLFKFIMSIVAAVRDYRRSGEFEWNHPAILFCTLIFTLSATLWMWNILGWGSAA